MLSAEDWILGTCIKFNIAIPFNLVQTLLFNGINFTLFSDVHLSCGRSKRMQLTCALPRHKTASRPGYSLHQHLAIKARFNYYLPLSRT